MFYSKKLSRYKTIKHCLLTTSLCFYGYSIHATNSLMLDFSYHYETLSVFQQDGEVVATINQETTPQQLVDLKKFFQQHDL